MGGVIVSTLVPFLSNTRHLASSMWYVVPSCLELNFAPFGRLGLEEGGGGDFLPIKDEWASSPLLTGKGHVLEL